jgi:hypothetical protein
MTIPTSKPMRTLPPAGPSRSTVRTANGNFDPKLENGAACLDQRHQHIKCAPAELDRLAVG